MTIYFLFFDGVGLGINEPAINPLVTAEMPFINGLIGSKLVAGVAPFSSPKVAVHSLDTTLGIGGFPQSATGQAVLITGVNVPEKIGYHYGPKPDQQTANFLINGGLFGELLQNRRSVRYLNAYPQRYFDTIESGKHLYSSFPLAATNSGIELLTQQHLLDNIAVSADITGIGWSQFLKVENIPVQDPNEVGKMVALNSTEIDLVFFEYWSTDYAGHHQDMNESVRILSELDAFVAGIAQNMQEDDLILITSDHGNIEDLATRRHTMNPVPLILIGSQRIRAPFENARSLLDVVPGIRKLLIP